MNYVTVLKTGMGVARRKSVWLVETILDGVSPRELVKHMVAAGTLHLAFEVLKHFHLF